MTTVDEVIRIGTELFDRPMIQGLAHVPEGHRAREAAFWVRWNHQRLRRKWYVNEAVT